MKTPGYPLKLSQDGMVDPSVFETDPTGAALMTVFPRELAFGRSIAGASGGIDAATGTSIVDVQSCYARAPGDEALGGSELNHPDFVAFGTKWGPSQTFGTTGGTVTWSIAGAGLT